MKIGQMLNIFFGFVVLTSVGLAHFFGQVDLSQMSWLWLTVFAGFNSFQMGFTKFCPLKSVLKVAGAKE